MPKPLPKAFDPCALAYSIDSLAELTDLSRQTMYNEIKAGHLVARKIGRRTLILHQDADQWLANLPMFTPRNHDGPARREPASMPLTPVIEQAAADRNRRGFQMGS